jgi:2-polyprenyl-6-methoxyphenol hydroxylase-like FAD-dependent oxidoreductase
VFLAGDAAHAFPPSGGFGLNTGIGDAFCLAHKLSSNPGYPVCKTTSIDYNNERQLIGRLTKDFALLNYQKSLDIAKRLGLYQSHASLFTNLVSSYAPDTGSIFGKLTGFDK